MEDTCSALKLVIFSSISLIQLVCFVAPVESKSTCLDNGNYTRNSTYSDNLDRAISSVSSSINDTGFSYASFGQDPDRAHVLVLCRADVSLDSCKNCMHMAVSDIRSSCPNQKQALNWQEQDLCLLKYSNETFYDRLQMVNKFHYFNVNNATSPVQFKEDLMNLLDDLRSEAADGGDLMKMAARDVTGPDYQTIYAMVQCTPDLSRDECTSCLINAGSDIPWVCQTKIGCIILVDSCFLRYETYRFYNITRIRELTIPSSSFGPPPPPLAGSKSKSDDNKTPTVVIIISVAVVVLVVSVIAGCIIFFRKRTIIRQHGLNLNENDEIIIESLRFDYSQMRDATNDFYDENKLGEGGFGVVYKGKLEDGQEIAVKKLSENSVQGELEFKNEVLLLARLQHRNLVRLLGFTLEGSEKLLMYEFVQNGSLDQFIFDPVKRWQLDWDIRRKIIGGIARGIVYLHEDSRFRIIHRDLKASNVLLDSEMNPKIADFGMARLFVQDDQTQGRTSRIVGTYGYMSPEYAMHGRFSVKSDVFSFGVLLLEIISGLKNTSFRNEDDTIQDLLGFAWRNWREGSGANVIDPILKSGSDSIIEMLRCLHIGLLCVQDKVADRPTMASVVLMLSSSSITLALPSEPGFFIQSSVGYESNASEINEVSSSARSNPDLSRNEASITDVYPR